MINIEQELREAAQESNVFLAAAKESIQTLQRLLPEMEWSVAVRATATIRHLKRQYGLY